MATIGSKEMLENFQIEVFPFLNTIDNSFDGNNSIVLQPVNIYKQ
jgi:hypothetical protein